MADGATTGRGASLGARFAMAKFRPTTLPTTLVTRFVLHDRLTEGAGQRLTVVVGSAGAGKSVLLSSWAVARPPGVTSWLSCDEADAELRVRDRAREQALQLRAAEWFESAGDMRRAARHFLAAQQADRALALLQDRVVPDFLHDPAIPAALDLSTVDPSLLADAPDRLLALATDLLLSGHAARGGEYLDLLDRVQPPIRPESRLAARLAAMRSFHYAQIGQLDEAVGEALAARAIQERTRLQDEWNAAVPLILLRIYPCLEDLQAVEREAAAALAMPELTEPAKLVLVPSAQALAWFESGRLAEAARAARAADEDARRLGFDQHFFAVDYLRVLAGLALERRDLDTAEQLAERVLTITERRRPIFEFLALLDRAGIWASCGQVREALTTISTSRPGRDRVGSAGEGR